VYGASPGWSTLIIRVWTEGDDGKTLRARLVELEDTKGPERSVAVAGDADGVLDATRAWLERVTGAG
jgi:hypothetical protein